MSAGVLAIALGGGLPLLVAAPAQAFDCTTGGGLVSGITGGLCSVVDGVGHVVDKVTDVADKATGGVTAPVTKVVDGAVSTTTGTAGTALQGVGQAVDDTTGAVARTVDSTVGAALGGTSGGATGGGAIGAAVGGTVGAVKDVTGSVGPTAGPTPGHVAEGITGGLTDAVQGTCLPLLSGAACADRKKKPSGTGGGPRPAVTPGTLPSEPYRPVARPSYVPVSDDSSTAVTRVNPDEDGTISLLWPGRHMPELARQMWQSAPVRPHKSYDGAGTALTAALLLSAVLATRVVTARRARAGQQETIPFEGGLRVRGRSGRHRLA